VYAGFAGLIKQTEQYKKLQRELVSKTQHIPQTPLLGLNTGKSGL
jgi:hypothetical protein